MDGADVAGFIQAAATVAFLAKLAVDGIKIATDLPRAAPVVLAFVAAIVFQGLLMLSKQSAFDGPTIAGGAIIAFVAWGLAIGVTMAQTKADKVEAKIQTALDSTAGTTREQLDKIVERQN